jgi:hypothetical protein
MVLQQDTDGFPAHRRPQLPFRRFLADQPYASPRPAFRLRAANHGHDRSFCPPFRTRARPGRGFSYRAQSSPSSS